MTVAEILNPVQCLPKQTDFAVYEAALNAVIEQPGQSYPNTSPPSTACRPIRRVALRIAAPACITSPAAWWPGGVRRVPSNVLSASSRFPARTAGRRATASHDSMTMDRRRGVMSRRLGGKSIRAVADWLTGAGIRRLYLAAIPDVNQGGLGPGVDAELLEGPIQVIAYGLGLEIKDLSRLLVCLAVRHLGEHP